MIDLVAALDLLDHGPPEPPGSVASVLARAGIRAGPVRELCTAARVEPTGLADLGPARGELTLGALVVLRAAAAAERDGADWAGCADAALHAAIRLLDLLPPAGVTTTGSTTADRSRHVPRVRSPAPATGRVVGARDTPGRDTR